MRMILKLFVWPMVLLLGLGCCIYCAVQARWTELAIFTVTVVSLFLVLFVMIWLITNAEDLHKWMRDFLAS